MRDVRSLAFAAAEAASCERCALAATRTQVVFGAGDPHANLFVIGEAPGKDEDLRGEPFVGRAGEFLTTALRDAGTPRETIYIANTVKCRPPANRVPAPDEIQACFSWLDEQIALVDPLVILTLGNVASRLILQTDVGITNLRGRAHLSGSRWVVPTLHPSYVLRSGRSGARATEFAADLSLAVTTMKRLQADRDGGAA